MDDIFWVDKWTNIVMDDGWVHPLAKTLPSLVSNLRWNIVTDDWKLDENLQGMTNNVGLPFSVGDTTLRIPIEIGATKYHI